MAWTERYVTTTGAGLHDGSSEANAWDLAEAITNVNAGHRVNVKAGTYANTTTSRTFGTGAGAATTTAPKWWRGYKTAIGDMDAHPATTRTAGTDFPLLTFTSGTVLVSDPHNIFSNFEVRGTAPGTRMVSVTGSKCKFVRCRFDCQEAATTSYTVRASADGICFTDCWFKGTTTATTVVVSEERISYTGCVFRGGGNGVMLDVSTGDQEVIDCVFDDNGDDAIEVIGSTARNCIIDGCTIYSPGGNGVLVTTNVPVMMLVRNNLFHTITTASKYGVNMVSGTNVPHIVGNTWYNVTTKFNNVTEDLEFFAIAESTEPLTDPANHDMTMVTGSAGKGAALPSLFENESYKSFRDGGAVQREEAAGGGGGLKLIGSGGLAA